MSQANQPISMPASGLNRRGLLAAGGAALFAGSAVIPATSSPRASCL
jgi:hypothetical protein